MLYTPKRKLFFFQVAMNPRQLHSTKKHPNPTKVALKNL